MTQDRPSGGSKGVALLPTDGRRVTIITVVYNGVRYIERAIRSVLAQDYPAVDYIVVDGASTDGTVDVIRKYGERITRWISEPDRGSAEAQNKAVKMATGTYIAWCFADDWLEPDFVSRSVAAIERSGADFSFGDMVFHLDGKPVYTIAGDPDYGRRIRFRTPNINYPTTMVKRTAFDRVGFYDEALRVAPDYDWLLRFHLSGARGVYDKTIRYNFSLGGNSQVNKMTGYIESIRIAWRHGSLWTGTASALVHAAYVAHHLFWNRWGPGSRLIRAERRLRREAARGAPAK
jgi:glycosyltransferase involved in cell wall biosynthesis